MNVVREGNKPLWLQVFTGVAVMALLVLTTLGNVLLMLLVALALLMIGFMVFGRELGQPGAWAAILGIIPASSIALLAQKPATCRRQRVFDVRQQGLSPWEEGGHHGSDTQAHLSLYRHHLCPAL